DEKSALTYNDPTGRPLAPKLPPPPIDGPDVELKAKQELASAAPGARLIRDRGGRPWVLGNQGRVRQVIGAPPPAKIWEVYGANCEGILGEKISTKPVEVVTPFPWVREGIKGGAVRN